MWKLNYDIIIQIKMENWSPNGKCWPSLQVLSLFASVASLSLCWGSEAFLPLCLYWFVFNNILFLIKVFNNILTDSSKKKKK